MIRLRFPLVQLGGLVAFALLAMLGAAPGAVRADGNWLDDPRPANWNTPGMALPVAPPPETPIDPRAAARERPAETPEDEALVGAGWRLFAPYQAGWGVKVLQAAGSYDGMGRPWRYQAFVFVDGVFAGTLAPGPMDSRTDGALDRLAFFGETISAEFRRYAPTDPLCCPSGATTVTYRIERGEQGAVVVPISASTSAQPAETTPVAPPASAPAATPAESYTVQPDDSLTVIAIRLYGDPAAWLGLYEANRESIGPDPNRLPVGLVLVVPPSEAKVSEGS